MGERVLVTGATGYVAGHCIEELLRHGYAVRGTVRRPGDTAAVAHLRAIADEVGGELELVEAHLDRDDGWDAAVAGCPLVMHVASPLPIENPTDEEALLGPAREGTLRVLRAAARGGVRRVVQTSSVAAVHYSGTPEDHVCTEADWSDPALTPLYPKSKTLAERAAWDFHASLPEAERFELVVMNPALVIGPVQRDRTNASVEPIRRLLSRAMPAVPALSWNLVDVRDVAVAHRLGLESDVAPGSRYILSNGSWWFRDVSRVLAEAFRGEGLRPPTRHLPYPVLWLASRFDPVLRRILPDIGRQRIYSSDKARTELGWEPRDPRQSIVDTGRSLLDHGIVTK